MIAEQVLKLTHQLRLFGFHNAAERRAEEAVAGQLHPLEFMRLLLEDEILHRKERIAKTMTTRAKFRHEACLEDFDMTYDRGLTKPRMKELSLLLFLQRRENLILLGRTGEGKTHLAIAIGKRCCAEGHATRFMPMNFLFEEVAAAKAAGKYLGFLRTLSRPPLLILDDFGLRSYTHEEATILLDLLEERYQKGSIVVTSQVDDLGWFKLFEDPVIAEAIVDRIKHPSQKMVLTGGSYRKRLKGS